MSTASTAPSRKTIAALCLLLLVALGLRGAAVWKWQNNLRTDPDAYVALAEQLAAGRGYINPHTQAPTAFRPPLYPLLIAGILKLGGGPIMLGVVQTLLGTGTVLLTWLLGKNLGGSIVGWLAAGLVTIDPLLLQNTTLPMTETLSAFLVTLTLLLLSGKQQFEKISPGWYGFLLGILFALSALCRPTFWGFVGLWGAWRGIHWLFRQDSREHRMRELACILGMIAGAAILMNNWFQWNRRQLNAPILTTTHGGYTLLLGNNPVFYREVVQQKWGTVWDGASLHRWQQSLEEEMSAENIAPTDEVRRDQWMYAKAKSHIRDQPMLFLRACLLRIGRFWNLVPLTVQEAGVSKLMLWGVGGFYLIESVLLIWGCFELRKLPHASWMPLVLMILSLTMIHTVYWSNMRMRAPIIPCIAIVAALPLAKLWAYFSSSPSPEKSTD